jgi:hypothetical protein
MAERKDRLIQTRVPERLEVTLKDEARRHRTTVSSMIRNILEDAFDLVDGVVSNVDQIVTDSVELAQKVGRDARKVGHLGQKAPRDLSSPCREPLADSEARLDHVQAWNKVVLNQPVACTKCGAELLKGYRAYTELSTHSNDSRAWLCARAVESLSIQDEVPEAEGEK